MDVFHKTNIEKKNEVTKKYIKYDFIKIKFKNIKIIVMVHTYAMIL